MIELIISLVIAGVALLAVGDLALRSIKKDLKGRDRLK